MPETCSAVPKRATCSTPFRAGQRRLQVSKILALDAPGLQADHLRDLLGRPVDQLLAVGDVGDVVALDGLIHVVGRDQNRDTGIRQAADFIPEVTPGLGIDTRGRLVQQQQFGAVQETGRQRQALFPAAGKVAGKLVGALRQTQIVQSAS